MKNHQRNRRQSCREYHAFKAGDFVEGLQKKRTRQMQHRNNINHATSAQHEPRTSHTHTIKTKSAIMKTHHIKPRQSCREYRAFKAGDWVAVLCITRKRQMQHRNKINHATSAPNAPRTSHTHTPQNQNQQ